MPNDSSEEGFVAQEVTYTLEVGGRFVIVERLQKIVWENQAPTRIVEAPVFDFPAAASV
jgi:hypothetical protein